MSERLVAQRVRNRIVECLEYLAEGDEGIRAVGDCEYFNAFFEWLDDHPPSVWRGNSTMSTHETIDSGWPRRIAPVAQSALEQLVQRGRFDKEHEEATSSH